MPIPSMAEMPDTSSQGTMACHSPLDMRTDQLRGYQMKGEEWGGRRKSPLASYCSQIKMTFFGNFTNAPASVTRQHGDEPFFPSFSVVIVGMQIQLNGSARTITPAMTVAGLVRELGVPSASVVIEHNRAILQPDSYATVLLEDNDQVEIIRFVGGG